MAKRKNERRPQNLWFQWRPKSKKKFSSSLGRKTPATSPPALASLARAPPPPVPPVRAEALVLGGKAGGFDRSLGIFPKPRKASTPQNGRALEKPWLTRSILVSWWIQKNNSFPSPAREVPYEKSARWKTKTSSVTKIAKTKRNPTKQKNIQIQKKVFT